MQQQQPIFCKIGCWNFRSFTNIKHKLIHTHTHTHTHTLTLPSTLTSTFLWFVGFKTWYLKIYLIDSHNNVMMCYGVWSTSLPGLDESIPLPFGQLFINTHLMWSFVFTSRAPNPAFRFPWGSRGRAADTSVMCSNQGGRPSNLTVVQGWNSSGVISKLYDQ